VSQDGRVGGIVFMDGQLAFSRARLATVDTNTGEESVFVGLEGNAIAGHMATNKKMHKNMAVWNNKHRCYKPLRKPHVELKIFSMNKKHENRTNRGHKSSCGSI
jgi:hypothetical protein